MRTLVEEAVREYLESAAITDLEPTQVAEALAALLGELHNMLTVPRHRLKRLMGRATPANSID